MNKDHDPDNIEWWSPRIAGYEPFQVGGFIGQGRRMQYAGIASAVINETENYRDLFDDSVESFDVVAEHVSARLQHKPTSWWVISVISLSLVLLEVMMAFTVSFITPTVGLGCRSFSCGLVAIFSSISWTLSLFVRTPPKWVRIVSHSVNGVVIAILVAIIGFQLTGGMNNCWCKANMLDFRFGYGGYFDFENAAFYRENFDVKKFWALGTALGGLVPLAAFVVAVFCWMRCQHMWSANDRTHAYQLQTIHANTEWLL
jgi:hypothetical protein